MATPEHTPHPLSCESLSAATLSLPCIQPLSHSHIILQQVLADIAESGLEKSIKHKSQVPCSYWRGGREKEKEGEGGGGRGGGERGRRRVNEKREKHF